MRNIRLILTVILFGTLSLNAADLVEVTPVTSKIIMLKFDDGYIKKHGYHQGGDMDESFLWYLDTELADNPLSYSILSGDDANYSSPLNPGNIGRKSKGHDFSRKCINWNEEPWPGAACKNDYASYHYIYLDLPFALEDGKSYTLQLNGLADNLKEYSFIYDVETMRANSIHTNNFGYAPQAGKKYAYISQWMGTMGPLTDDELIGKRFDICQLDAAGNITSSVYNGVVGKQKDYNVKDNNRSNETPYSNYVVSNVYECDFSDFADEGEYVLVVEDVGASYPFRINADAYHEAFYWTMKGLYLERALIDAPAEYGLKWEHPAWTDAEFVYTSVRTMDLTDESGNNQKLNIYNNFDWTVDLSNIRGWYHDAGDWDGYFSHFRVPRSLMYTYELAPDNFSDDELDIPEAQVEFNGYSGTHVPDILDEAVWLVDYFKNNVGPTGGIFGSRVHPDISTESEALGITAENYPDFTFRSCRTDGIPSWEDCATWIVHGEDPRDSYAFASIAAQYAFNLGIAEDKTGEDYTEIITDYTSAAEAAYTWAAANTLTGDESKKHFVENRAAAAAWLYKLTGTSTYLDQLKSDLTAKNITASTTDLGESKWAVWAYVMMDGTDPLYSGTFDATLQSDLLAAVKKYANDRVTNAIDANRSMRWGGGMMQPTFNGQGTTPWILPAMVASVACDNHGDPDAEKYLDACFTTNDYFLGGNQLNMVWLTYAGHEHAEQIMHHDSKYNPDHPGFIPGIPPYGPRNRCDWFAPGGDHPYAGDNCFYNNSHDGDFALLDGRIYPAYTDSKNDLVWPVHELYFENYGCPPTNEYTVHQTVAPAAAAYGFVTAPGGNASPNEEPSIEISTASQSFTQGDDIAITITASDSDGWIYRIFLYADNRLITVLDGDETTYTFQAGDAGETEITAKAEDNLGLSSMSGALNLTISEATDAPEITIVKLLNGGLYRIDEPLTIKAEASGQNISVAFYLYNEKIGEDDAEPYQIEWTPSETGDALITAVAEDDRGLTAEDSRKLVMTSNCLTMVSPDEDEEIELGSNVVVKVNPQSCSEEISKVILYISRALFQEDFTVSPGDGTYGVSFKDVSAGEYIAYAIAETVSGQMISDSVHFAVFDPGNGIGYNDIESMSVYPNPSTNGFYFKMELNKASEYEIYLYDQTGRMVQHYRNIAEAAEYYWDTEELPAGFYAYRVVVNNTIRNGNLVLTK